MLSFRRRPRIGVSIHAPVQGATNRDSKGPFIDRFQSTLLYKERRFRGLT